MRRRLCIESAPPSALFQRRSSYRLAPSYQVRDSLSRHSILNLAPRSASTVLPLGSSSTGSLRTLHHPGASEIPLGGRSKSTFPNPRPLLLSYLERRNNYPLLDNLLTPNSLSPTFTPFLRSNPVGSATSACPINHISRLINHHHGVLQSTEDAQRRHAASSR